MSTAIYYSNHNMPVDDNHNSRNLLPSLSQIMPPVSSNTTTANNQSTDYNALNSSPNLSTFQHGFYQSNNQPVAQVLEYNSPVSTTQTTPSSSSSTFTSYQQPSSNLYPHHETSLSTSPTNSVSPVSPSSSITTTSTNDSTTYKHGKCICKLNPNKIPRPRNAFILFRQKYHQTVLDEGTVIRTNPEVSRELGRRWRSLSSIEREHWTNLAEEEKRNHAKKYPGYKYTPRRNGKSKDCPACKDKPNTKRNNSTSDIQQAQQLQQIVQAQEQYQQLLKQQQMNYIIPTSQSNNSNNNLPILQQSLNPFHFYEQDKLSPMSIYNNNNQNINAGHEQQQPQQQQQGVLLGNYSAQPQQNEYMISYDHRYSLPHAYPPHSNQQHSAVSYGSAGQTINSANSAGYPTFDTFNQNQQ